MKENFLQQLGEIRASGEPGWLSKSRKEAAVRFVALGLPTTDLEDWRYTSLEALKGVAFRPALRNDLGGEVESDFLERSAFCPRDALKLVFVNGYFSPNLSSTQGLPKGVVLGNLASLIDVRSDLPERFLGKTAGSDGRAFVALNSALMSDGAVVFLPKGTIVEQPIHLCYVSWNSGNSGNSGNGAGESPTVSHPRNLIIAEDGAQATFVEIYVGGGKTPYLTNAVTEILAGPDSRIDHYVLQQENGNAFHIRSLDVHQESQSHVSSLVVSLGAALARNESRTILDAEGAECTLNGLYMVTGRQHVDNQTSIDHAKPHGTSSELYKGVLSGHATGVFNGRIHVRPDAQKTSSRQTNKNLLLSNDALVNTKPLLEIFANDVKCNHGATIGRLDEAQVFYLRSRGLSDAHARSLLTYAFASDLVTKIRVPTLQVGLEKWIFRRLLAGEIPAGVSGTGAQA